MTAEIEARLLAAVANLDQLQRLQDLGIREESFVEHQPLYRYVRQVAEEFGRLPRLHDIRETFNLGVAVSREPGEFDFCLADFRRTLLAKRMQDILDTNVSEYADDPGELVDNVVNELMSLRAADSRLVSATDHSMPQRMEKYARWARDRGGNRMAGIATGMSLFDEALGLGWMPGELIGVVGRTYIGKSWLLLYFGAVAWSAGNPVVFVSPEMSLEETEARFDALLFARRGIPVDIADLYKGYYPDDRMRELAGVVGQRRHWLTYAASEGEPLTVTLLGRLIKQQQPRLLIVDGLPLMEGHDRKRQVWETIKQLSYGLKTLAVTHAITILVSHQANRAAHNTGRAPALHEISLGDTFAHACDRILTLSRPPQDNILKVSVQKFRRGESHLGTNFYFKPGKGEIHELLGGDDPGIVGTNGDAGQARAGVAERLSIP